MGVHVVCINEFISFFFKIYYIRPNGKIFVAAPTATLIHSQQQLKEDDIVLFKHRGYWLSNQSPKSPSIYRIRSDLTCDHVLHSFHNRKSQSDGSFFFKEQFF